MTAIVHRAGIVIEARGRLRQRCAWCGATLFDYELARVAIVSAPDAPSSGPSTAAADSWWAIDGHVGYLVADETLEDGSTQIPDGACLDLDPATTA